MHPVPSFAYVISGTLTVALKDGRQLRFTARIKVSPNPSTCCTMARTWAQRRSTSSSSISERNVTNRR
jgi:hypothetical protein